MSAGAAPSPPAPWLTRTAPWFAPLSVGVAILAALSLVDEPVGIGFTLALVVIYAAAAVATGRRAGFAAVCWWGAALLAGIATLRSAGWLVALCLLASLALAAIAATEARTWRGLLFTSFESTLSGILGLGVIAGLLGRERRERTGKAGPVVRGLLIAAALVLVFGSLFVAGDAVFAKTVADLTGWLPAVDETLPVRIFTAAVFLALAGALARLATATVEHTPDPNPRAGRLGRIEWTIALGALDALFAVFVVLQAMVVLRGHEYVVQTAGMTYAEYVHQGFAAQMVAAALTLTVIAAAWHLARRDSPAEDRLLRTLLGGLCGLTLAVLAFCVWRIDLYVEAYGATQLRILVVVIAIWLATVFIALIVAGIRRSASWLPRAVVLSTGAILLGLALVNPDAWIADRNIDRYQRTGKIDLPYLEGLSDDAVPVLATRLADNPSLNLAQHEADLQPPEGLVGFNIGRERARAALDAQPPPNP
ncbi:MAG: hypothetical protein QOG62_1608 [Thermoleophilaceae bacterium]|nr:hypothetical protein [Thermoleophilaceae bacterium]